MRNSTIVSKKSSGQSPSLGNCKTLLLESQRLLGNLNSRQTAEIEKLKESKKAFYSLVQALPAENIIACLENATTQIHLACLHPWHAFDRACVLR
jgi:hypothetical protein